MPSSRVGDQAAHADVLAFDADAACATRPNEGDLGRVLGGAGQRPLNLTSAQSIRFLASIGYLEVGIASPSS